MPTYVSDFATIVSQSCPSSSSSPTTSGGAAADRMSLYFTNPIVLHSATHIRAQVDWTESWLRRCDSKIQPLLKMHLTLTDVARKVSVESRQLCHAHGHILFFFFFPFPPLESHPLSLNHISFCYLHSPLYLTAIHLWA